MNYIVRRFFFTLYRSPKCVCWLVGKKKMIYDHLVCCDPKGLLCPRGTLQTQRTLGLVLELRQLVISQPINGLHRQICIEIQLLQYHTLKLGRMLINCPT